MKGLCGREIRVKIWKQGHSIKCQRGSHPRTNIRYWKPDPSIEEEIKDFCKYCTEASK